MLLTNHQFSMLLLYLQRTVFIVVMIAILTVIVMAIIDACQRKDAVRHNYPFIGRFRNFFMHIGVFFRAYFFTEDRQEMPFNRADREWVYRASYSADTGMEAAFGSTRSLITPGHYMFANAAFPLLDDRDIKTSSITFGADSQHPYTTDKFFHVSAMSFGAISKPAVLSLSHGAQMASIMMDTGEGGISPYHLEGGCDLIAEIGTAKYGYRSEDGKLDDDKLRQAAALPQVKLFSIKLSQGAKPGKGGVLPGEKVTPEIAKIRGIRVGQDSISPNRWPEISSNDELLDMIAHIREVTGKPVGCKFVVGNEQSFEALCQLIQGRGIAAAPDFIIIDSADGGTGAAAVSLMDYVGLRLADSLPMLTNLLIKYDLRQRIKVGCSGKLITPGGVAWALAMGADFVNSARGFMFSLGCIQAMRCDKNSCPTGVTTHKKHLQAGLDPSLKKNRVKNYADVMHRQVELIAHSCGVKDPRQLNRQHVHMAQGDGRSIQADKLWPYPDEGVEKLV